MSRSYNRNKKEHRKHRYEYELAEGSLTQDDVDYLHHMRCQIRNGKVPRFHLLKDPTTGSLPKLKIKKWKMNLTTKEYEPVMGGAEFVLMDTMNMVLQQLKSEHKKVER